MLDVWSQTEEDILSPLAVVMNINRCSTICDGRYDDMRSVAGLVLICISTHLLVLLPILLDVKCRSFTLCSNDVGIHCIMIRFCSRSMYSCIFPRGNVLQVRLRCI